MAMLAARLAGRGLARYAPRLYGGLRRSYMSNPTKFVNNAKAVARAGGVALSYGASVLGKRKATQAQKVSAAKSMKGVKGMRNVVTNGRKMGYRGSGVYKGKFMTRKRMKTMKVDFSKFGVSQKIEEFGEVDDNDTVYVITPCANDVKVLETLIGSLLKKLLKMGIKWDCTSWTDEILWNPASGSIDPAGLFINMYGGRPDTTDGTYDVIASYTMTNGDTLSVLIAQFINSFIQYSAGTLGSNANTEIYSFVLGSTVRNAANTGFINQTLGVIYFDQEVVHWKGGSRLKIQNRTNSVNASTSTDVNDAKPLEGYIYDFRGLPRLRASGTGDFKSIDVSLNTKTFGAATCPADFKEPPPSRTFANCTGRKKVHLDPGEIKEVTCYGQGSMQLKPFLKKICAEDSLSLTIQTMFKTQMLALEELINSTDVNAVKVGFENAVSIAVTCVTKQKKCVTVPRYKATNISETV